METMLDRLKMLMEQNNFERSDLIERLGCSRHTVNGWFSLPGRKGISKKYVPLVAKILGVSEHYLRYGKEDEVVTESFGKLQEISFNGNSYSFKDADRDCIYDMSIYRNHCFFVYKSKVDGYLENDDILILEKEPTIDVKDGSYLVIKNGRQFFVNVLLEGLFIDNSEYITVICQGKQQAFTEEEYNSELPLRFRVVKIERNL